MQPDTLNQNLRGAALLMRQGTAAWMRWVIRPSGHSASPSTPAPATIPTTEPSVAPRPSAIEQMLVNIVAAMALVHAKEVSA